MIDDAVSRAPVPAAAEVAVARLVEDRPEARDRLESDERLAAAFAVVASASRALTRTLLTDPGALGALGDLDVKQQAVVDDVESLVAWKHRELLRIAARDLLDIDPLEEVGANLADLADDVFRLSLALSPGAADELAVIAMGKWGARELNYASDVDVLFVGDGDPRPVMDAARSCFRVDANLRPEGRDGPLTRSLASYEAYWDRWAEPWEFQALLKARPAAGDRELGEDFARAAAARVWGRELGAEELRSLRDMKARSETEVARKGLAEREIKRAPGGIRDIEFAVQLLQLVHGRTDEALRRPATIAALSELARAGYVDGADAADLERAYRFLRSVEHRLQLVDEQQVHVIPTDRGAVARLARVLGYRDTADADADAIFEADLRRHQARVRAIHERLYFRPLLEAFARAPGAMSVEAAETRLSAFGFADAARTRQALEELTRGLTRSSRLMQQLLPLLLQWLAESPDPDLGLLGLRTLATGEHRAARLVTTFRESPEAARRLCLLLGTSRLLQRGFEHHPDLIAVLAAADGLTPRTRPRVLERINASMGWRGGREEQQRAVLRKKDREVLRISSADVVGLLDVDRVGAALTALAEAVLESALAIIDSPVPLAVVALGRFGGAELSYASDLDIVVVHDAQTPEESAHAEIAAEQLLRLVNGDTPSTRIWAVDAGLRPEGRQGPVARSLDSYAAYYERWAETWERQALLRARPVAGDGRVADLFMELAAAFVESPITEEEIREIRRMKARIEKERIPAGEDPQFHLKLGRGSLSDVEWTAQLLQLQHGVRSTGTVTALDELLRANAIPDDEHRVLVEAYRFCERTRNRWFLVKGGPGDSLPTRGDDLAKLARSLGTSATELREQYRRVTRRARAVMERLFYGQGPARPNSG